MKPLPRVGAAVVAGGLLALSAPPFGVWPLALAGMLALAWTLDEVRPRRALLLGWIIGSVTTLATMHWVVGTITRYTSLGRLAAITACVLLAVITGATLAAAAWLAGVARP